MTERVAGSITLPLEDELRSELARIAEKRQTTELDLVKTAVRRFVRAEQNPGLPRFARRLGPIADG